MSYNIIILNPPYINYNKNKELKKETKKNYYSVFIEKSLSLLSYGGILSVIAPFNFKETLYNEEKIERVISSKFEINSIAICVKIFKNTTAKPIILNLSKKRPYEKNKIKVFNFKENKSFEIDQFVKENKDASFIINSDDETSKKLILRSKEQLDKWKNLIKNNQTYLNYYYQIEKYNKDLKAGQVEISGILGISGNGVSAPNINKYIAVLDGTEHAEKLRSKRAEVFLQSDISKNYGINNKKDAIDFLENLSNDELDKFFTQILFVDNKNRRKPIYYKIIKKEQVVDLSELSDFDLNYGFAENNKYVSLIKQFDSQQKWYQESPFFIDWSKEFVENSKKSLNFRNYYLFLKPGIFINTINQNIIAKEKHTGAFLANLIAYCPINIPFYYFLCVFNSSFINKNFLSNYPNIIFITQNLIRIIPIVIPDESTLETSKNIYEKAKSVTLKYFNKEINEKEYNDIMLMIEQDNDKFVESIYKNALL